MRTTQTTEKTTKRYKISVTNIQPFSPTSVVLTLTTFDRKGGEA